MIRSFLDVLWLLPGNTLLHRQRVKVIVYDFTIATNEHVLPDVDMLHRIYRATRDACSSPMAIRPPWRATIIVR